MSRRRTIMVLAALILSTSAFAAPAAATSQTSPGCASLSAMGWPYPVSVSSITVGSGPEFFAGDVVTVTVSNFENVTDVVTVDSAFAADGPSGPRIPWGTITVANPTLSWRVPDAGAWAFILSIGSTVDEQEPGTVAITFACRELELSAFEAPVDAAPMVNLAQAGRTLPFKFTATDHDGNPVTDLTTDDVTPVTDLAAGACGSTTNVSAIETYSSGGGALTHLGDGHYLYTLQTDKTWRGTCGTVGVKVRGVEQTADFQFRS